MGIKVSVLAPHPLGYPSGALALFRIVVECPLIEEMVLGYSATGTSSEIPVVRDKVVEVALSDDSSLEFFVHECRDSDAVFLSNVCQLPKSLVIEVVKRVRSVERVFAVIHEGIAYECTALEWVCRVSWITPLVFDASYIRFVLPPHARKRAAIVGHPVPEIPSISAVSKRELYVMVRRWDWPVAKSFVIQLAQSLPEYRILVQGAFTEVTELARSMGLENVVAVPPLQPSRLAQIESSTTLAILFRCPTGYLNVVIPTQLFENYGYAPVIAPSNDFTLTTSLCRRLVTLVNAPTISVKHVVENLHRLDELRQRHTENYEMFVRELRACTWLKRVLETTSTRA